MSNVVILAQVSTAFGYGRTVGYYSDSVSSRIYVRARYLRPSQARWLTIDPIWPSELAYNYCLSSPHSFIDPTGLTCRCDCAGNRDNVGQCGSITTEFRAACKRFCHELEKAFRAVMDQCDSSGAYSQATHQIVESGDRGPWVKGDPYTKMCRAQFDPGGPGENGDFGNKSDGRLQLCPFPGISEVILVVNIVTKNVSWKFAE